MPQRYGMEKAPSEMLFNPYDDGVPAILENLKGLNHWVLPSIENKHREQLQPFPQVLQERSRDLRRQQ